MRRLFLLAAAFLISGALAVGQGVSPGQPAQSSGAEPRTNPAQAQSRVSVAPSSRNQDLPGSANPVHAATKEGSANGEALRPGSASGRASVGPATPDHHAPQKDDSSNNPTRT